MSCSTSLQCISEKTISLSYHSFRSCDEVRHLVGATLTLVAQQLVHLRRFPRSSMASQWGWDLPRLSRSALSQAALTLALRPSPPMRSRGKTAGRARSQWAFPWPPVKIRMSSCDYPFPFCVSRLTFSHSLVWNWIVCYFVKELAYIFLKRCYVCVCMRAYVCIYTHTYKRHICHINILICLRCWDFWDAEHVPVYEERLAQSLSSRRSSPTTPTGVYMNFYRFFPCNTLLKYVCVFILRYRLRLEFFSAALASHLTNYSWLLSCVHTTYWITTPAPLCGNASPAICAAPRVLTATSRLSALFPWPAYALLCMTHVSLAL